MENISIDEDALQLAKAIYRAMVSKEKWGVFNIFFLRKREILSPPVPKPKGLIIPASFGYLYGIQTVFLLEKFGVIEAKSPEKWFVGISSDKSDSEMGSYDKEAVSIFARKKGYLDPDLHLVFYFYDTHGVAFRNLFSILVNRQKLEEFISVYGKAKVRRVLLPQERDYWYNEGQLKFRLSDGDIDQFDFSKAELSRKMFESFWKLWKKDGKGRYSNKQIIDEYKKSFKEELESGRIGEIVSNVRSTIINPKRQIKNRLVWKFNRKNQEWLFRPQP